MTYVHTAERGKEKGGKKFEEGPGGKNLHVQKKQIREKKARNNKS